MSPTVIFSDFFLHLFEYKNTLMTIGDAIIDVFVELSRTKCLRTANIIAIFSDFSYFKIKPEMRDVLAKMREFGK